MKVLFVSSGNSKDGISPIVKNQGNSLIEQGLQLNFFTIKGKGLWSYFRHIFILRKFLKLNKYDIIHAHFGFCGIVALFARRNEKIVTSFMGDDLVGSNKTDGSITFSSKIHSRINIIVAQVFYDHTIVKSAEMMQLFKNKSKIALIPNGVDTESFREIQKDFAIQHTKFDPNKKNIIFVSDPKRTEKNHSLAKNAVLALENSSVELHAIYGMPNDQLMFYYNSADLLLMTSFHEGSPNVVKEAMACNCPLVCTDVGDVKLLTGKTEGCYITSFKIDDVAEKIKLAMEFAIDKGRTNGRERIAELGLDAESTAKKILEIYNRCLLNRN